MLVSRTVLSNPFAILQMWQMVNSMWQISQNWVVLNKYWGQLEISNLIHTFMFKNLKKLNRDLAQDIHFRKVP